MVVAILIGVVVVIATIVAISCVLINKDEED